MWVLLCGVFLGVAETIVGSPVCCYVGIVFLGVVESIVGWPVCCYAVIALWSVSWFCGNHCWFACAFSYVGIVLWNVSWCCRNQCWFACVLMCGYCFVECFLVLRKL